MGNHCCGNSSNQTADMPKKNKTKSGKVNQSQDKQDIKIGTIDESDWLKPIAKERR